MPLGMALAAPIDPSTTNGPHSLSNRTTTTFVEFDTLPNTATNDPNRIDGFYEPALDDGSSNYNYAANEPSGGPSHCNDPDEYFGQAMGYPDVDLAPMMVASGQRGTWTSKSKGPDGTTTLAETRTALSACKGVSLNGFARTKYLLGEGLFNFQKVFDGVKVERTFRFSTGLGVLTNGGLRAFVPRVPILLHYVLVPNKEGQLVTYDSNNCTTAPCAVTDWDGTWIADDFGGGSGLLIIRDPSSIVPAFIGIQSGGAAN